jgi:LysR family transcriptional activator of nhaA
MLGARMEWLNYHHLLYFHAVAREGSVSRAARLRLAQPTLSGQIRKLEHVLGEKLFERQGRNLVLTEVGRVAYRYSEEIFSLGQELLDTLHGRPTARAPRLQIGISDIVPKLVAHRLIAAAGLADQGTHLVLREGKTDDLVVALATQAYDVLITDAPWLRRSGEGVQPSARRIGITFFASRAGGAPSRHFPKSLDGAPLLLPTDNTSRADPRAVVPGDRGAAAHRRRDRGQRPAQGLRPARGGIFPVPSIVAADVRRRYGTRRPPPRRSAKLLRDHHRAAHPPRGGGDRAAARTRLFVAGPASHRFFDECDELSTGRR